MDGQVIRKIQREGAEALLDAGVSLPLKDLRIPFRKQPPAASPDDEASYTFKAAKDRACLPVYGHDGGRTGSDGP